MAQKLEIDTSFKPSLNDSQSDNSVLLSPVKLPGQTNVRVIARFRPMMELEENEIMEDEKQISYVNEKSVALYLGHSEWTNFSFDKVFTPEATQVEMFDFVGTPICQDVVAGYNGTVFAYGQTGSGKTHSMMGDLYDQELKGIIPR